MKHLKALFKFYLHASIHVALSVYAMAWITIKEFQLPYDENLLYFIFYASITGYNFVKYFGLAKFHRRAFAGWLMAIQLFSLVCFVFMCFYALKLAVVTLCIICGFGAITFMYAIPVMPKRFFVDKNHNLRSISGLKVYVIGLVWAGVTVVLPLINQHYKINDTVILTFFQRFILVIALMLPFELRDLKYDSLRLGTIPQKIGVKHTKILGVLLSLVFFFLEFFKPDVSGRQIIIALVIVFILMLFILFSKREQPDTYTSFWVEGIPVVWLLLHIFFKI